MNAVVVLTRGYESKDKYATLIKRNKHLEKFYKEDIDFIIFHEGNITLDHQKHIMDNTLLPLIFVNVSNVFKTKQESFYPPSKNFGIGYRNMCNFWFCGFWDYVSKYEKILRVDEDCDLHTDYAHIFKSLDDKVAVFGRWADDVDIVTKDLNNFTLEFMRNNGMMGETKKPRGPYTNIMGFNLLLLRKNSLLERYVKSIYESNNIYYYRWGDLPLWGEVLHYFYKPNEYECLLKIKYYHASHNRNVNF